MKEQEAISKMVAPGQPRPGIWRNGVLQIWVTRSCDKSCFGCTQGSNLKGPFQRITTDQFDEACSSLAGYFGVVGMFGGNPCTHPEFETLCEIMRSHFPKEQCGLWSNKLFGKGKIARQTFNPRYSNLNVHMDKKAYEEFKSDWPEADVKGLEDSRHSPPYVAMQDLIDDEEKRWALISDCDINKYWSAFLGVFRNELRAWFCEIAGAQAMLHQNEKDYPDTGMKPFPGWWRLPIEEFSHQIKKHCHACGIPLRGYGSLAITGEREQVTKTHANVYQPKIKNREVEVVTTIEQINEQALGKATNYIENGSLK